MIDIHQGLSCSNKILESMMLHEIVPKHLCNRSLNLTRRPDRTGARPDKEARSHRRTGLLGPGLLRRDDLLLAPASNCGPNWAARCAFRSRRARARCSGGATDDGLLEQLGQDGLHRGHLCCSAHLSGKVGRSVAHRSGMATRKADLTCGPRSLGDGGRRGGQEGLS
jgi:hypothetical protein